MALLGSKESKKKSSAVDDVQAVLREHEEALKAARERAREVEREASREKGLEAELARLHARRDRALALGDEHPAYPWTAEVKGFGHLQMEPMRALESGNEIAAKLQPQIDDVEGQLRGIQAAVEKLTAP